MAGLLVGGCVSLGAYFLIRHHKHNARTAGEEDTYIPIVQYAATGSVVSCESFGDYVVRQLRLPPGLQVSVLLAQVAEDYLRGDKGPTDSSRLKLMELIMSETPEQDAGGIIVDVIHELDRCILSYFAHHWKHTAVILEQIKTGVQERKRFKRFVSGMIRSKRMEKVMQVLGRTHQFVTLLEMLSTVSMKQNPNCPPPGEVMVPANKGLRPPVLLMVGGGMGAGKSTVIKEILNGCFWVNEASNAVVVEADAFKEKSLIYRTMRTLEGVDSGHISQMVHESSTLAASSTLVTALNEGRDVIFDGTMSWAPFVIQTVEMVRNCHKQRYRLGLGYQRLSDGTVIEEYWDTMDDEEEEEIDDADEEVPNGEGNGGANGQESQEVKQQQQQETEEDQVYMAATVSDQMGNRNGSFLNGTPESPSGKGKSARQRKQPAERKPYRIEFVGVACDAGLAVTRGMRRAILTGRGVPVESQLRSHRMFAEAFPKYCAIVDHAKLYSTDDLGGPPKLIALKDHESGILTDHEPYTRFLELANLNEKADSITELFKPPTESRLSSMIHDKSRKVCQDRIKSALTFKQASNPDPDVGGSSLSAL